MRPGAPCEADVNKVIHRKREQLRRIPPNQALTSESSKPLPHPPVDGVSLRPPLAPSLFVSSLPTHLVHVALQTPAHSGVGDLLSYASAAPLPPGTLVRVPLGAREVLGVVWDAPEGAGQPPAALPPGATLRAVAAVLEGIAPLAAPWRQLVAFAARYYQRGLGEVALAAFERALAIGVTTVTSPGSITENVSRSEMPSPTRALVGAVTNAPLITNRTSWPSMVRRSGESAANLSG